MTLAADDKLRAETEKLRAETEKLTIETARARAEADAAELAAEQVRIATERERWKREVELCSDTHHGVYRLTGAIDATSVARAVDTLAVWRRLNPETRQLKFIIDSLGGEVIAGVHLFDHIRSIAASGVTVTTVVAGVAASMGAILSQAGDVRVITPSASFMLHEAAFGVGGKALSLDTPLPTPSGWTAMGDVAVGDVLYDERGRPTTVVGTYDVTPEAAYRVEFSDGSHLVAADDHRWWALDDSTRAGGDHDHDRDWVRRLRAKGRQPVTTREMVESHWTYSIPVAQPILGGSDECDIHPYVLGAWLGDGYSSEPNICGNHDDLAVIHAHIASLGYRVSPLKDMGQRHDLTDTDLYQFRLEGTRRMFAAAGLLGDKHIPREYLRASVGARMALLAGLVDTDGHVNSNGSVELTSSHPRLAEGIYELVTSLGFKATRRWRDTAHRPSCRITFMPQRGERVARLERKQARAGGRTGLSRRTITAITEVPVEPMRCITVDSPSHLFLAGEAMVPTHNTSEVEDRTEWVRMIEDRFAQIIAERANYTPRQLKNRWSRKDWWMMAEEAVTDGFFDRLGTADDLL